MQNTRQNKLLLSGTGLTALERTFQCMINDRKLHIAHTLSLSDDEKRNILKRIDQSPCFEAPSKHYITDIYMQKYNLEKESMIEIINSTEANSLSLDHTFKFSKFVTIQSSRGHHYSKAFSALLIVMNENGEIVSFKPTVGESMKDEAVTKMLEDIKIISPNINIKMTDNCCHIKQILNDIFPGAKVKLDLWHAMSRVQKSLKKTLKKCDRFRFNKQLSNCFRQSDDQGKKRLRETSSEEEIREKLNKLKTDWISLVPSATIKEIELLMDKHSSCLAGIPKGYGTNKNESLHRALNALFSDKAIMSLHIAEALLTTFLFRRKFQDVPLFNRPIMNTHPKL